MVFPNRKIYSNLFLGSVPSRKFNLNYKEASKHDLSLE